MKLQRVSFLGVRGIADTTMDFGRRESGPPHDLVILAGPAGAGKTRALEAILAAKEAVAPYGPPGAGAPWIAPGSTIAKVVLAFHLDEDERTYAATSSDVLEAEVQFFPQRTRADAPEGLVAVLERYSHDRAHGKLEYFPASRRIPFEPPFGGLGTNAQRLYRTTRDARKYGFVPRLLQHLERDRALAREFASRLEALSPTCRHAPGSGGEGMPRSLSSRGGTAMRPSEISDSEADAVIFAATAVAIGLDRSLVLVDRPELHLDLRSAKSFLGGLRALGEDNQLLIASSSPEIIAAAEGARVVCLENP
jgi:hypothetical protein